MKVANLINSIQQRGFLRGPVVLLLGLLFMVFSVFSHADMEVRIGSPAHMTSVQIPGPLSAEAIVTATLASFNNAALRFDQETLALAVGIVSPLTLTVANTGVNNLDGASLLVTFPEGLLPVFPADPRYNVVQQTANSWLVTLIDSLLPGTSLDINIELDVRPGTADGIGEIIAELSANGLFIRDTKAAAIIGDAVAGLFLVHQVDRNVVEDNEAVRYTLAVSNPLAITVGSVVLSNVLPAGVRFVPGSVTINNVAAADPQLGKDGRSLDFALGDIAAGATVSVSYVAYVSAASKAGQLVNVSSAAGSNAVSNHANAVIYVRKDAMDIQSHVVGRVLVDSCSADQQQAHGKTQLHLRSELAGEQVQYTLTLENAGVPVQDYRVHLQLPEVFTYIEGTASLDGSALAAPQQQNGQQVFAIGDMPADSKRQLVFRVQPQAGTVGFYETAVYATYQVADKGMQQSATLVNSYEARAAARQYRKFTYASHFNTLDARLQPQDMASIDKLKKELVNDELSHITVIGHTDSRRIHGAGKRKFADNNVLSMARAAAVADHLVKVLGISADRITVIGKGADDPLADNRTAEGRRKNRRVEVLVEVVEGPSLKIDSVLLGEDAIASGSVYQQTIIENQGEKPSQQGLAGVRLMMEDGRFVDTDADGRYHFEGLKPGTHVIQIDPASIPEGYEPWLCDNNTRFTRTATSQFVDIQQGLIWRANFHLRSVAREQAIATALKLKGRIVNQQLHYLLSAEGSALTQADARVMLMLPEALRLQAESVTLAGKRIAAVQEATTENGMTIWRIDLPDASSDWQHEIGFVADITALAAGEYTSSAYLQVQHAGGDIQTSNPVATVLAVSKPAVRVEHYELDTAAVTASPAAREQQEQLATELARMLRGQTIDKVEIVTPGTADSAQAVPASTSTEPALDADAMAARLADKLGIAADRIQVRTTDQSDAAIARADKPVQGVQVYVHQQDQQAALLTEMRQPESIRQQQTLRLSELPLKQQESAVQATAQAALPQGILSMKEGDVLAGRFASIRINVDSRLKHELTVDGQPVPESRIGFRQADPVSNKTLYTYFGVNLGAPGEHELRLKGIDTFGNTRFDQLVRYARSGDISRIRFVGADNNVADGKTPVVARIELIDDAGKVIHAGTDLMISSGELLPYDENNAANVPLVKDSNRMLAVDHEGYVRFKPVSKPGLYRMQVEYNGVHAELKIPVKPEFREWVMVGIADGVIGYDSVTGNMQSLEANDIDDQYYDDGKLAFYAKGKVSGKYLLTVAFDSSKADVEDERLLQMIDPNEYYTLYGDNTEQRYDAASREKLYLRLDAEKFYALFGDFNTDLTVTKLSRYSRSFTGAKFVYEAEQVSANAFAAQADSMFTRDEILGDGTSGLYRLSNRNIVINSERLILQVRDRFYSERIISERPLSRFVDYNLDYIDGTLYFKQPVMRHDENFNPVYIVAEYEVQGQGKNTLVGGGRAAVQLADDKVELGVSHIDEGMSGEGATLSGVDATVDLTERLQLKTEYAESQKTVLTQPLQGEAYMAELMYRGNKSEALVYIDEQDSDFGLGQLNRSESGMRKTGARGSMMLDENVKFEADAGRQQNLDNDGRRDLLKGNVIYTPEDWEFTAGATMAEDTILNGQQHSSEMLNTGIARTLFDDRVRLYNRSDWQLSGNSGNLDYPERHLFGSSYLVTDDIDVYTEYEIANNSFIDAHSSRAGVRSRPWENATMNNALQQDVSNIMARSFAVFGLSQAVPISDNWRASLSYDQTKTIDEKTYTRVNEEIPLASGSTNSILSSNGMADEDFWATTAGVGYQSELYLFDSRMEYREADTQIKYGLFAGWQRNLLDGIGHALRWQGFVTEDVVFGDQFDTQLRYSLVVRPLGSDVFWFNRTELKHMNLDSIAGSNITNKFVEHLAINWVPNIDWQVATHIGYKLTDADVDTSVFTTHTFLLGNETRYNLSPRWDVGAHYHVLSTADVGLLQDSYGMSVGVDLAKNLWLSMGYNVEGFSDDDFTANGYTAKGPFLKLRFKFDQDTFNLND